jgi:membrane protease YdiL (CAAX protease family)
MPWDFWLIFVALGVLIPWRGRERLKHLLARPAVGTKEKLVLYGATIAFQWLLCGLAAWRAVARGLTAAELGLGRRIDFELVLFSLVGAALLCAFQWFNLRRMSRILVPATELMRKLAERLLPSKPVEFGPYCALAVTAGVCEEFLYRGFAMAALTRVGMPAWSVVLMSSVLFGLAHAYQGKGGIIGTGLLGLVFGTMRLAVGSLFPVVLWHAGVDVVAGVAGPRFLVERKSIGEAANG